MGPQNTNTTNFGSNSGTVSSGNNNIPSRRRLGMRVSNPTPSNGGDIILPTDGQPRKNKAPLLLIGFAAVLIIIIAVVAIALPKGSNTKGKAQENIGTKFREQFAEATKGYNLDDIEHELIELYNGKRSVDEFLKEEAYKFYDKADETLAVYQNAFNDVQISKLTDEEKAQFEKIKNGFKDNVDTYEKIIEGYKKIYNAIEKGDAGAQKELAENKNKDIRNYYDKISGAIAADDTLYSQYENLGCVYNALIYGCEDLNNQMANNDKILSSGEPVSGFFHAYTGNKELSKDSLASKQISKLIYQMEYKNIKTTDDEEQNEQE